MTWIPPKDEMIKLHFNTAAGCNLGWARSGGVPKDKEGRIFIYVMNLFAWQLTIGSTPKLRQKGSSFA